MLCFGGGHDLYISNDCNSNTKSYSDLGDSYEAPDGFKYQSGQARSYLAGSLNFSVSEIEVYKIILV